MLGFFGDWNVGRLLNAASILLGAVYYLNCLSNIGLTLLDSMYHKYYRFHLDYLNLRHIEF